MEDWIDLPSDNVSPFLSSCGREEDKMFRIMFAVLALPGLLSAETILFHDDFNDGDAVGWIPMFGEGTYFVNSSFRYELSYSGPNNVDPCTVRGDSLGIYMCVSDYSVVLEGICHDPSDFIGVFLRGTFAETGYALFLRYPYQDLSIMRHDGPGVHIPLKDVSFNLEYEANYWIKFQCEGNSLTGKVWQGTVEDEPAEWTIATTDATYSNCGFAGFVTGNVYSGDSHAEFDNVMVTTDYVALEAFTWGAIKATVWK